MAQPRSSVDFVQEGERYIPSLEHVLASPIMTPLWINSTPAQNGARFATGSPSNNFPFSYGLFEVVAAATTTTPHMNLILMSRNRNDNSPQSMQLTGMWKSEVLTQQLSSVSNLPVYYATFGPVSYLFAVPNLEKDRSNLPDYHIYLVSRPESLRNLGGFDSGDNSGFGQQGGFGQQPPQRQQSNFGGRQQGGFGGRQQGGGGFGGGGGGFAQPTQQPQQRQPRAYVVPPTGVYRNQAPVQQMHRQAPAPVPVQQAEQYDDFLEVPAVQAPTRAPRATRASRASQAPQAPQEYLEMDPMAE